MSGGFASVDIDEVSQEKVREIIAQLPLNMTAFPEAAQRVRLNTLLEIAFIRGATWAAERQIDTISKELLERAAPTGDQH